MYPAGYDELLILLAVRLTGRTVAMGHGWAGRLRPTTTAVLSGRRRRADLLLGRQCRQPAERVGEMVAGAAALPADRSARRGRHEDRPASGREDDPGAGGAEGARAELQRPRRRRTHLGRGAPRMFRQEQRGRTRGVRSGRQSRPPLQAKQASHVSTTVGLN